MLRYYEKLGVDNTWYAGKQETAIFRAPDEENDRQLRKGHHHRQYPRQQMQRKTTTCLDQRHYRLDRLIDKQSIADGLGSKMLERRCSSCRQSS